VKEKNSALYLMGEFEFGKVSGNAGLRYVETTVDTVAYQLLASGTAAGQCVPMQPCSVPGAIVGSRVGTYVAQPTSITHKATLPSLNLRWNIDPKLVGRFALSQSMGRPNYNEMAAAVSLDNIRGTGTTGNPYLKPVESTNVDASLAWYFAPRAYVSGGVFSADLKNYVKPRTSTLSFIDTTTGLARDYVVSTRAGVKAKLRGFEVATEVPVGAGFGVGANYTYVDSKDADGQPMMGASKDTYNLVGFFENDQFSARMAWNFRSDYAYATIGNGSGTPTRDAAGVVTAYNGLHFYKGYGALSLSLNYKINERMSIALDGNNLNDPVRNTYQMTQNAPTNWYVSGRQYYLNLRLKM
jgi:iron complex outermembrane recepter protein